MKAACIIEPGKMVLKEMEKPVIMAETEVLVNVKMVGICGSDMHIFEGKNVFATYPRVWGHEFCGIVEETGSGVYDLATGDHVICEPIEYCGECYACRMGRPNVCQKLGVRGVHIDGGCREYLTIDRSKLYKISPDVPWKTAVLTEPLTIGFQANYRALTREGDIVLIQGSGTIGLMCLLAAKRLGAVCIMTDILPEKLEYAKKLGADYIINIKEENLEDRVNEISDGMGPNVILDGVGSAESLAAAVEMVSVAGRVVELGFNTITSAVNHNTVMKKEVGIFGTRLQTHQFGEAVEYVEQHRDILADFVTQEYGLDKAGEAMDFAIHNGSKVRKVVVAL